MMAVNTNCGGKYIMHYPWLHQNKKVQFRVLRVCSSSEELPSKQEAVTYETKWC